MRSLRVAAAHLTAALGSDLRTLLLLLRPVIAAGSARMLHGPVLVFILAALILALHHRARWAGG